MLIYNWSGRPDTPGAEIGWTTAAAARRRDAARPRAVLQRRRDRAAEPIRDAAQSGHDPTTSIEVPSNVTEPTTRQDARIPEMTEEAPSTSTSPSARSATQPWRRAATSGRVRPRRPQRATTATSAPCATSRSTSTSTRSPRSSDRRVAARSTVLRCFNRMNDFIETARVEGKVLYHGVDLYDPASTPSRSGAGSAWCSRSRTRSRSASTTTSPSAHGSSACKKQRRARRRSSSGRCAAPRCGTRSRTV